MAIRTYMTDKEHDQSALDRVARMTFDRASEILSDGNPILGHIKALQILSNVAVFAGFSNTVINTYYQILDDENNKNNDMEGWYKDDFE